MNKLNVLVSIDDPEQLYLQYGVDSDKYIELNGRDLLLYQKAAYDLAINKQFTTSCHWEDIQDKATFICFLTPEGFRPTVPAVYKVLWDRHDIGVTNDTND